jgi:hypothetical protein
MRRPPLRLPDGLPGETVLVNIFNPIENRRNGGKVRPAVLLREISGHYRTVGLTSNPKFGDGQPRRPVPNPKLIGLAGPGYIWGFPTSVSS